MQQIKTPGYLKEGDTIGIIAPARSVSEEEIQPFLDLLQKKGYLCVLGKNLFKRAHQFAGNEKQRLDDLHSMFANNEVKAVFAARGGYGSAGLISAIDWSLVTSNPKWLIGFSDISALHAAFGHHMKTIHGVMPYSLVMKEAQDSQSHEQLFKILEGEQPVYTLEDHPLNIHGEAEGILTGGNLSVLYSLAGTPYEPDYENKILFIEDLDEYLYHIDRMILNFELRGIFKKISGLLVGSFSDMHDNPLPFGKNSYEIIAEKANKYKLPALFGFPAGHEKTNLPLIFGDLNTLRVKDGENSLSIT